MEPGSGGAVGGGGAREESVKGAEELQEETLRMLERLKGEGKTPWEGWCIEFEVLKEGGPGGGNGRMRSSAEAEERTPPFSSSSRRHF